MTKSYTLVYLIVFADELISLGPLDVTVIEIVCPCQNHCVYR